MRVRPGFFDDEHFKSVDEVSLLRAGASREVIRQFVEYFCNFEITSSDEKIARMIQDDLDAAQMAVTEKIFKQQRDVTQGAVERAVEALMAKSEGMKALSSKIETIDYLEV